VNETKILQKTIEIIISEGKSYQNTMKLDNNKGLYSEILLDVMKFQEIIE
jgi:hypothetical protein